MYTDISQIYNNLKKDQNRIHYLEMPLVYFQDWVATIFFSFSFKKPLGHPTVTLGDSPETLRKLCLSVIME